MNIPKTIKQAESRLDNIGGLIQATEWERAAIVYAFTEVREEGGDKRSITARSSSDRLSMVEFAKKGIVGLKSKDTVRRYHQAWQKAIDSGEAYAVTPGDAYAAPDMGWPPEERTDRQSGATVPRVAGMLSEKGNMSEVVEAMSVSDLIPLINAAQKKVDSKKTPRPVSEAGPLDVMASISDMDDALHKLEKAEPAWSTAIKEGHINSAVYEEEIARIEIVHTLMKIAGGSESFEMEVPRT